MGAKRSTRQDMSTTTGVRMEPATGEQPAQPATATRQDTEPTTRITINLPSSLHRAIRRDLMQLAEDLGRTRVTTQDVGAALFELLDEDEQLRRMVKEWIATGRTDTRYEYSDE